MEPVSAYGYMFKEAGMALERVDFEIDSIDVGEVVVKVAGCGLCHTDLSFITGQVKPNRMPVILGHEISGTVIAVGDDSLSRLMNKPVIIPAVMPCGNCDFCKGGRANVCRSQVFPGNDFNGGFASHVSVPGRFVCPVPEADGGIPLSTLSVIADAITTPYQSMLKGRVESGDLAVVVGTGGIGIYMVQWARHAGAVTVALDIDDTKLEKARSMGADHVLNIRDKTDAEVKKLARGLAKEKSLPRHGWKVFETSGTAAGQGVAFSLLSFAGVLVVVGFTMDKLNLRLSNVMAFDAEIIGNWACKPEHYAAVVKEVVEGRIKIIENVEEHTLDSINEIVELAKAHKLERRAVFTP